ncbi:MAG: DUF3592 domain-containing protein [Campylobacteraceae bacterium]|jgi:hypothetical protein|nr:DUF3592 domain-containing protein [Campylobacteraceae bacterium]
MSKNNRPTRKGKVLQIIFAAFIIFISLIFLAAVLSGLDRTLFFKMHGVEITAQISQIKARREGFSRREDVTYTVFVSYAYDSEVYEGELNYYTSSMEMGDEIDIYIDPANPKEISATGGLWLYCVFVAMSVFVAYIGFVILRAGLRIKVD